MKSQTNQLLYSHDWRVILNAYGNVMIVTLRCVNCGLVMTFSSPEFSSSEATTCNVIGRVYVPIKEGDP